VEVKAGVIGAARGLEGEVGVIMVARGTGVVVGVMGVSDRQPLQREQSNHLGAWSNPSLYNTGGQTT
jgi:hypothetical protein